MTPQSAKAKGRRRVAALRDELLARFPSLEPDDIRIPATSQPGCDLHLSPAAQKVFPYGIEAKNVERLNVWEALAQAETNSPDSLTPLLVMSRNHGHTYAVLRLEHLFALLRASKQTDGAT